MVLQYDLQAIINSYYYFLPLRTDVTKLGVKITPGAYVDFVG